MAGTALIPAQNRPVGERAADALDLAALELARASKSPATLRAYQFDFADFSGWLQDQELEHPADARDVARYLAAQVQAGLKASTIERTAARISSCSSASL